MCTFAASTSPPPLLSNELNELDMRLMREPAASRRALLHSDSSKKGADEHMKGERCLSLSRECECNGLQKFIHSAVCVPRLPLNFGRFAHRARELLRAQMRTISHCDGGPVTD